MRAAFPLMPASNSQLRTGEFPENGLTFTRRLQCVEENALDAGRYFVKHSDSTTTIAAIALGRRELMG
jgi:hypothetical protein